MQEGNHEVAQTCSLPDVSPPAGASPSEGKAEESTRTLLGILRRGLSRRTTLTLGAQKMLLPVSRCDCPLPDVLTGITSEASL